MPVQQVKNRQTIIREHFDVFAVRMLEVGALDIPTFRPDQVNIQFMDWFTTEELKEKYPHRKVDNMPSVDFPVKSKRFAEHVDAQFDLIIGNHVLEHVPDPLAWIGEAEALLNPGGAVFFSVPDKRYTFDMIRELTDFAELLRCYHADLERPDIYQLLRAFYYWRPVKAMEAWNEDVADQLQRTRYTIAQAMELAAEAEKTYTDVHCHVFTAATFPALWADVVGGGFSKLRLSFIDDVQQDDNEFHVILAAEDWESTPTRRPPRSRALDVKDRLSRASARLTERKR